MAVFMWIYALLVAAQQQELQAQQTKEQQALQMTEPQTPLCYRAGKIDCLTATTINFDYFFDINITTTDIIEMGPNVNRSARGSYYFKSDGVKPYPPGQDGISSN